MARSLVRSALAMATLLVIADAALAAVPTDLDARVEAAMREHGVPGMAIAIVEDGKPVLAKGYGVRKLGSPERGRCRHDLPDRFDRQGDHHRGAGGAGRRRQAEAGTTRSSTTCRGSACTTRGSRAR